MWHVRWQDGHPTSTSRSQTCASLRQEGLSATAAASCGSEAAAGALNDLRRERGLLGAGSGGHGALAGGAGASDVSTVVEEFPRDFKGDLSCNMYVSEVVAKSGEASGQTLRM